MGGGEVRVTFDCFVQAVVGGEVGHFSQLELPSAIFVCEPLRHPGRLVAFCVADGAAHACQPDQQACSFGL